MTARRAAAPQEQRLPLVTHYCTSVWIKYHNARNAPLPRLARAQTCREFSTDHRDDSEEARKKCHVVKRDQNQPLDYFGTKILQRCLQRDFLVYFSSRTTSAHVCKTLKELFILYFFSWNETLMVFTATPAIVSWSADAEPFHAALEGEEFQGSIITISARATRLELGLQSKWNRLQRKWIQIFFDILRNTGNEGSGLKYRRLNSFQSIGDVSTKRCHGVGGAWVIDTCNVHATAAGERTKEP